MKTLHLFIFASIVSIFTISCGKDDIITPEGVTLQMSNPFVYYGSQMDGEIKFEIKGSKTTFLNHDDSGKIKITDGTEAVVTEDKRLTAIYTLTAKIPSGFDSLRIYVGSSQHKFYAGEIRIQIGNKLFKVTDKELDETYKTVRDSSVTDTWNNAGGKLTEFPIDIDGSNLLGRNTSCGGHAYTDLEFQGLSSHEGEMLSVIVTGSITKDDDVSIGAFGGDASFIPTEDSGFKPGYTANFGQRKHLLYQFAEEEDGLPQ